MSWTRAVAAGLLAGTALAAPARACSDADWKACDGKPWIVGALETPLGERWWPNPLWGPADEAGSTNWYARPEVVQRALAEARSGRTWRLGRAGVAAGPADTRLDGLARIGVALDDSGRGAVRFYNGATGLEVDGVNGPRRNGIDRLQPIVARGILVDIAGAKGVPFLDAGTEITMADVRDALARQGLGGLRLLPGDAVVFRTGWGAQAAQDGARFAAGEPGIGIEVARWLSDDVQAGLVGSDTWGLEAVPAKDEACVRCVQRHLLVRHGIVLQHNLELDALAADQAWRFLYLFSPWPVPGAPGSAGSPLAVR